MATPAYGLLRADIPPTSASDERYAPDLTATNYSVTNDTAFDLDWAHTFEGAVTQFTTLWLKDCHTSDITMGYTSASVYDEMRCGFELRYDRSQDGGAQGDAGAKWDTFFRVGGSGNEEVTIQFSHHDFGSGAPNVLRKMRIRVVRDDSVAEVSTAYTWTRTSTFTKWEVGIKRLSGGLLEVKAYIRDGSQNNIMTATTTTTSAWRFGFVEVGSTTTGDKGVTYTCRFGKVLASWNSGSSGVTLDAQQWLWDWDGATALTWSTWDFPNADVTNEFTSGGFAEVDDAIGSYVHTANHALLTATVDRKRLLLAWPDVTYAAGTHIQAVVINSKVQDNGGLLAFLQSRSGAEAVSGSITNPGDDDASNYQGVWTLTPQSTRWTQTKINETDFGIEKPASASLAGASDAMWRLILSGGTTIESDPTEDAVAGQPILRRSGAVPHMALGQSAVRRRY